MKVLMIGDIVGKPGRKCVRDLLPQIKVNYNIDFVIANGENAAGGRGITREISDKLFSYGIDVITMGNHVWDNKEVFNFIDREKRIIRPANYPPEVPGRGYGIYSCNDLNIGVFNLSGRVFMPSLDCPFRKADTIIDELNDKCDILILDFHAEATSEKIAMGRYLDGRVAAVFGTHTHVQTADERVLEGGSSFITDTGMTGPLDSILGMDSENVIKKFLTQLPARFEVARGAAAQFNGVIINIDENTGLTSSIERFQETHEF